MVEFTPSQKLDLFSCIALANLTYAETAEYLNAKYGTSFSASQVGRERRKVSDRWESGEALESLMLEVYVHGLVEYLLNGQ